jgi:GcrA cell cycle regulator
MTEETMLRDPAPQQIEPLAEAAPGTRCTLMKLTRRTCRWPIGDPKSGDFCFCGATSMRGRPYCEFHLGVAYHAPAQRK